MNFKKRYNVFGKRIVISWLVSYLILFSIPVLSSLAIYQRAESTLENELQNSSNHMLETLQISTDETLYAISSLVMNISLSNEVKTLMSSSPNDEELSTLSLMFKLAYNLHSYKTYNKNITDIYIYFNHLEKGVSQGYLGDTEEFFNYIYSGTDITLEDWLKTIKSNNYGQSLIISAGGNITSVDFVYSLPVRSSAEVTASVIMRVDTSILENTINNFTTLKNQSIYILDSKNNNILTYGENLIPDIKYEDFPKDLEMEKADKLATISKTSPVNSWRYISVIPQKAIDNQLGHLRQLIVITFFFCLVIGGILVVYFVKKHYTPIANLLNLGKKRINNSPDDDYLLLNEIMKDYIDTKSQLSTIQYNQKLRSKTEILESLLNGNLQSYKDIISEFKKFDIKFLSEYFVVTVLKTENEEALFEYEEVLDSENRDEAIQFIMTNVLEELVAVANKGYVAKTNGNIVCIISLNTDKLSTYKQDIETAFSEAKLFIEDNFSFSFSHYASDVHKSLENIPAAFNQAILKIDAVPTDIPDDLVEKIKIYISENYNNNALNVASVGDHFNITPYYASNVFKRTTNVSMLDYIGKYRVNKAKEIIKTHNPKLASVAEMVGFNNVRTFMRTFVKYEGITPGQYKEITGA